MVKLKLQIERHKIQRPVYLSDERFKKMQEEEKRRNESDKKWTKHLAEVREAIENQYNVDRDRDENDSNFITEVEGSDKRLSDYKDDMDEDDEDFDDPIDEEGEEEYYEDDDGDGENEMDEDVKEDEGDGNKKMGTKDPTGKRSIVYLIFFRKTQHSE